MKPSKARQSLTVFPSVRSKPNAKRARTPFRKPPHPLLPVLQEKFELRKGDAYRLALLWNRRHHGTLDEYQWGAWLKEDQ